MAKAVFVDRDGVINRAMVVDGRPFPPRKLKDFEILPGVEEACKRLHEANYLIIVVTNQPDIARGLSETDLVETFHNEIRRLLPVSEIFCCAHDEADCCECRKPKPGMLIQAQNQFGIDLTQSFMIGDRWKDVETGFNAGCQTIFIDYGYAEKLPQKPSNYTCSSLSDAADWILGSGLIN